MRLNRHFPARWTPIISLLLVVLALGGCSALRMGYNNAASLSYWWLDRYFDFDSAQSVRVRADLQATHDWHRKEELPLVVVLLKKLQTPTAQPVTPEQMCSLYAELKTRAEVILDHMVPTLAAIAPTLQDAQLAHIAQQFEKRNKTWHEEWLDGSPTERAERRAKATVNRAETFYGDLTDAQVALVKAQVNASDTDVEALYQERLTRQQDALQTLRELRNSSVTPQQAETQLHALLVRAMHPPDTSVRQSWNRWAGQSCAAVAALHNSISAAQRQHLVDTLKNYEGDVQILIAQP